jgi:iron complex outermembrane receptor protein
VGAYTQTNVPTSYRAGLELHGAVAPLNWLVVHANLTLSQNKIKNFTEYIDDYDNGGQQAVNHGTTDIAFSPNVIGALNLTLTPFRNIHGFRHLSVDINEKYVGRQYLDNTSNQYRSIDPYAFTNIIIHYGIAIHPFKAVEASLALNNIFSALYSNNGYTYSYIESGQTNTQNYFFPQAGFNVLGGLSFKW